MSIILKNGQIVTGEKTIPGDIEIASGKIGKIGDITPKPEDTVIDVVGKLILPGAIDVHTHLDLDVGTTKTADDFFSGTRAAIAGGTTMILDFATQNKGGTLKEALNEWNEKADGAAFCDFGFHMAIIDWNDSVKAEMTEMMREGVSSFKLYMAYKGSLQVDDGVIYHALQEAANIGGLIGFHCENGDLVATMSEELVSAGKVAPHYHPLSRPDTLEEESIFRLGEIAKLANAPIWVVHLSSEKGLRVIEQMRKDGVSVVTETCPQYLMLDDSVYGDADDTSFEGAKYVLSPPLRKQSDIGAMWEGLQSKEISFVSTDHCSFNWKGQKELGKDNFAKIPNGGPGIEHRLAIVYTYGVCEGKITINEMVKILSENPADVFGMNNKGKIESGRDADLLIFDPHFEDTITAKTQVQNVDYTPYEGYKRKGKVERVFLRGEEVFAEGSFLKNVATGKFIKREKSAPLSK